MHLLCNVVGHRRSKKWASFDSGTNCWHSICIRCHTRMTRSEDGRWSREKTPTGKVA
jgi:hypothetical protein